MDKHEQDATIAGEDLRKGDIVTVLSEGEGEKYAWKMLPTRKGATADGMVDADTKKGEAVPITSVKAWGYWSVPTAR